MSNYFNLAVEEDIKQNYLNAIELYEKAILDGDKRVEIYINLSFLYWIIGSKFYFRDHHKISDKEVSSFIYNYEKIIENGLRHHPDNLEIIFWQKYFLHRLYFDDLSYDEVVEIMNKSKEKNLIPYFFLYLFDNQKYKNEKELLMRECGEQKTAKNIYIMGILSTNYKS